MLMHLSTGHVTLLPGKFPPPKCFPIGFRVLAAGQTHVGLCPKFLVFSVIIWISCQHIQQIHWLFATTLLVTFKCMCMRQPTVWEWEICLYDIVNDLRWKTEASCYFNLAHEIKRTKMFYAELKWEKLKWKVMLCKTKRIQKQMIMGGIKPELKNWDNWNYKIVIKLWCFLDFYLTHDSDDVYYLYCIYPQIMLIAWKLSTPKSQQFMWVFISTH